jgi:hypothetical protein
MRVVAATAIVCLAALAVAARPNAQPAADKALTVILLGSAGGPTVSPERLGISTMVVAGVRQSYAGAVEFGEDLMTVDIADDVKVHRYRSSAP